jgi:UDP-N-acetylmuramoyl-L-alanyl-D-glutamate--2,6-diaminopimelate ligase
LLAPLVDSVSHLPDLVIHDLTCDSRTVTPGSCFIAISGTAADGHEFIPQAVAAGAVAVVYENEAYAHLIPATVAAVRVPGARRAAAVLADRFWDHPSGALTVVPVTGTNGKTSTVHLLEAIFQAAGFATGMIGTLGRRLAGDTVPAGRTTPDAIELQSLLARMRDAGVTHVSMELSSHALDLDRAWGCSFAGAVFTNLTPEHLDWHGDLATYQASKARLFTEYADLARPEHELVGAINTDDPAGQEMAAAARCRVVTFGLRREAMVRAEELVASARGSHFALVTPEYRTPVALRLVGRFNVYNALAAAAGAYGLGVAREAIVAGLEALDNVPGRVQSVDRGQPFGVLVDYAHTGDALANVLRAARDLSPRRLICVFGCGGDRDRSKRPEMGRLATELAEVAIITSDNPRSEDPLAIIGEIQRGATAGCYQVEPDRAAAIRLAMQLAEAGDLVAICGKGHENYQEFAGGRRVHFDDREVAAEALAELGFVGSRDHR